MIWHSDTRVAAKKLHLRKELTSVFGNNTV